MPDARQDTLPVACQPDSLARFRPAMRKIEHLLAGHDDLNRTVQFLGGNGCGHGFGIDAQLGSKPTADIGGQKPDLAFPDA